MTSYFVVSIFIYMCKGIVEMNGTYFSRELLVNLAFTYFVCWSFGIVGKA